MITSVETSYAARHRHATVLVYDLRVILNDEPRFFILDVTPARHIPFQRALRDAGDIVLEDYGVILHRGWDEPDDMLKAELRRRYGMYETLVSH